MENTCPEKIPNASYDNSIIGDMDRRIAQFIFVWES